MNAMRILLPFLLLCLTVFPVFAQDAFDQTAIQKQIAEQKAGIEQIEAKLAANGLAQDEILDLRQSLRNSREALQEVVKTVQPVFDDVKADIADLGPAPEGENAVPEPDNIKAKRAELTDKSLMTEGLIKEAEALSSKSVRLLEKVAAVRRGQFINQLFETQASPFNKTLWQNANQAFSNQIQGVAMPFADKAMGAKAGLIVSVLVFLVLLVASVVFSRKQLSVFAKSEVDNPLSIVAHSLVFPVAGVALGLLIIFQALIAQDIVSETNQVFVQKGFCLFAFIAAVFLVTARLSKAGLIRPTMRWLASLAGLIYAVDAFLLESGRFMGTPLELAIGQSYVVTTLFALILGALSFVILKKTKNDMQYFLPRKLFFILCGIALLLLAANIFGYAAFSRFVFERVILVFSLLIAVVLIRALARPYFAKIDKLFSQDEKEKIEGEENLVHFWLALSLDVVLFFLALPVLASIVGAETSDIKEWASQAFFGFTIGNMTISIANIGIAIILFLVLLFVTRLIQSILSSKILPKTKMDASICQSVIQVLGYVGLIIALLAGISAIGFDLTNLALIAGALSVGIGFGLQSIVSNFVSGLILLFERPIKVNDWIITNSGEGIVKEISVRATEIETFDKTSIIVPNSELIASSVKNWTHKDKIGRIIVTVGVSYDSDPHQVRELLLKCAQDNEYSIKTPEPSIHFKDFGDNALIFDLRFFIKNVGDTFKAATQMRLDIWDAFKVADIEISFPQRDLHIRSAPALEGLFGNGKKK